MLCTCRRGKSDTQRKAASRRSLRDSALRTIRQRLTARMRACGKKRVRNEPTVPTVYRQLKPSRLSVLSPCLVSVSRETDSSDSYILIIGTKALVGPWG